jgi:hypothetical protein
MKRVSSIALGLLFSLGSIPSIKAAPQFNGGRDRGQNRDRVCVYKDIHYQGWEQCYDVGDEVTSLGNRKKAISSIRVYGRARVIVWEDPEFHGHSQEFSSDVPDLGLRQLSGSKSWSDQIESLKVTSDYNAGSSRTPPPPPIFGRDDGRYNGRNDPGICVYDRPQYQGREQCWRTGSEISDLARTGNWSDRISSIRVFGRTAVVLYRDIQFRGESIVIDQDVPDLTKLAGRGFRSWDNQVSSLAVESERGGFPGRGRARGRF